MTFEQAWAVTEQIGGFFEREEAELYWRILESLPPHPVVVEVGVENGRSTSIPAQFGRQPHVRPLTLHCVDNFATFGMEGMARFNANMVALEAQWILWHNASSEMWDKQIEADLILIDADHDDVHGDCLTWVPKLKSGGWMLFHDYGREPWGIAEIVERHCKGWEGAVAGSLAARKKP